MATHIRTDDQNYDISDALRNRSAVLEDVGKLLGEINQRIVYCSLGKVNAEAGRRTFERAESLLRSLSMLLVEQDRRLFLAQHGAIPADYRDVMVELQKETGRLRDKLAKREAELQELMGAVESVVGLRGDGQ